MFISEAFAQAAGDSAAGGMSTIMQFAPFILIFIVLYFLILRPQRTQMKKRQELLNSVRRGDSIITGGGIIGKVTKVNDETGEVEVEIAENTRIRVLRSTISNVLVKGTPVAESAAKPAVKKPTPKAANKDKAPKA